MFFDVFFRLGSFVQVFDVQTAAEIHLVTDMAMHTSGNGGKSFSQ